jgi:uncharacterized protein
MAFVRRLAFFAFAFSSFSCNYLQAATDVSVVLLSDGKTLKVISGKVLPNVAWARFSNDINISG